MAQAIAFLDTVAVEVGVNEAVMLSNLHHWVMTNKEKEQNCFEGKYWTYDTIKSYAFKFPFWTYKQVRTILEHLEKGGYIESGNFNRKNFDRTKWYTLTPKGLSLFGSHDLPLWANGIAPEGKPIPHNNTHNNINIYIVELTQNVIDYLNSRAKKNYKATTGKTKSLISARHREGFVLQDFKTVIDKKCSQWLGTDMEKYLRPETLFGTKFEGYLNEQATTPTPQSSVWNNYGANSTPSAVGPARSVWDIHE